MNDGNEWLKKEEEMAKIFLEYFKGVYATFNPTEIKQIFQAIEIKVIEEINTSVLREFTSAEIKQALDQMNAGKASSFDGMTSCFY